MMGSHRLNEQQALYSALEALADAPPRCYLKRTDGSVTLLQRLYDQCAAAGLVPAEAADAIAQLHSLFDVMLEYGMGSAICDYIAEVCSDRLLTSSDPVEAFLLDGECVRRWAAKKLSVSQGRLSAWLGRGLAALGGSTVLPKELAKLRALRLVFAALAQPTPAAAAAQFGAGSRMAQQQQQQRQPVLPELAEAERLTQCAHAAAWLASQPLAFDRSSGRFSSEQEWRTVAAKRRDGAGPLGLFLTDMLASLAEHGVPALAYPAPSTDRLLSALFCTGAAASDALRAKLTLLAYHLLDGSFMTPEAIVEGLKQEFGVPRDMAHSWLLMQLLDAVHAPDAGGEAALSQAVALVPRVDGAALPTKAAGALQERGRPDVALRLLRQHRPPGPAAPLEEACVALGARLANGLLVEGYMVLSEHLATVAPAERPRHAAVLLGQLLDWATQLRCVNTVIRLHFTEEEEAAVVAWLERAAASGRSQAGLLLSLFYLMRGRVPEALLAYNRLCPAAPASEEQTQVLELLRSMSSMLAPAQRALVVRQGGAPALLVAEDGDDAGGEMEEAGDTGALLARLPELVAEGMPRLVAVAPDEAHAPLVGSVPALVNGSQAETVAATSAGEWTAGSSDAVVVVSTSGPPSPSAVEPMLFGHDAAAVAREAAAAAAPLPVLSRLAAAAPPPAVDQSGFLSGVVDFDAVLFGSAGKRRRPRLRA